MDLGKIMGQVRDMQTQMQERMKVTQENLKKISTTAESGAGMIKVEINGHRELIGLSIDADLLSVENKQMLQDLVMAATNKALLDIDEQIKAEMKKSTDGILPNIPGMDLSSFGM
jgi:nucleoid-associated protein EbfC